MKIWDYPTAKASDLTFGSILASGEIVESVSTGGIRYGDQVHFTFRSGKTGRCGKENRLHIQSL